MNELIGFPILILLIVGIALIRPYKRIMYLVIAVIFLLMLPFSGLGIYIKIIGLGAFLMLWRWRFPR